VLDERGLAGAVLPQDGQELALLDLQFHALQGRNAVRVAVREPLDLDDRLAVVVFPCFVGREQLLVAFRAHPPVPPPELLDSLFGREGKLFTRTELVEKAGHPQRHDPGLLQKFHIAQDLPRRPVPDHCAVLQNHDPVGVQGLLGLVLDDDERNVVSAP
jgi:hypothetical protein